MLTWAVERCCMCGGRSHLKFCPLCGHDFCEDCRVQYFRRGLEALKALIGRSSLYCGGRPHG